MRLERALPERIARDARSVETLGGRLLRIGPRLLEVPRASRDRRHAALEALSPLAILARGYSATFAEDDTTVITSIAQVAPGEVLHVNVRDGLIAAEVIETRPKEDR